jgi:hypothetical protein
MGRVSFLASLSEMLEIRHGLSRQREISHQEEDCPEDDHNCDTLSLRDVSGATDGSDADVSSSSFASQLDDITFNTDDHLISSSSTTLASSFTSPSTPLSRFNEELSMSSPNGEFPPVLGSPFLGWPAREEVPAKQEAVFFQHANTEFFREIDIHHHNDDDDENDMRANEDDLTVRQDLQPSGYMSSWTQSPPEAESSKVMPGPVVEASLLAMYSEQDQEVAFGNSEMQWPLGSPSEPSFDDLSSPTEAATVKQRLRSRLRPLRLVGIQLFYIRDGIFGVIDL